MVRTSPLVPFACAVVALLYVPLSANAAVTTRTYDFTVWDFTGVQGLAAPPVDIVTGSVTITLDPFLDYGEQYVEDVTTGITLNSLSIALDSPIGFNYDHVHQRLNMGGIQDGVDALVYDNDDPRTNDLWFNFRGMATSPHFVEMCYVQAGTPDAFYSSTGTLNVSSVPAPEAILLGTLGAGLVGWLRRRRTL
ncbi:MAG: hypothetical protein ABFE13_09260 [Phycisphaerales bacterium]